MRILEMTATSRLRSCTLVSGGPAKTLLDAGADLTARDEHLRSTPLAWAPKFGQLEMVKFLLERGAPKSLPDDPPWATPLAWAINRGHDGVAKLLV